MQKKWHFNCGSPKTLGALHNWWVKSPCTVTGKPVATISSVLAMYLPAPSILAGWHTWCKNGKRFCSKNSWQTFSNRCARGWTLLHPLVFTKSVRLTLSIFSQHTSMRSSSAFFWLGLFKTNFFTVFYPQAASTCPCFLLSHDQDVPHEKYVKRNMWATATEELACLGNMPSAKRVVPYRLSGFCMFRTLTSKQKHAIYIVRCFDLLHDRELHERESRCASSLSFWLQRQRT